MTHLANSVRPPKSLHAQQERRQVHVQRVRWGEPCMSLGKQAGQNKTGLEGEHVNVASLQPAVLLRKHRRAETGRS